MRGVQRQMHADARFERVHVRRVLTLPLVACAVPVAAVERFEFGLSKYFAIVRVEYVQQFVAADLEEKVDLRIDVIGGDAPRGADDERGAAASRSARNASPA